MEQLKIVFRKSLNPEPKTILHNQLLYGCREFNRRARASAEHFGQDYQEISFKKYLRMMHIDYSKFINQPFDRLQHYLSRAKYRNGVKYESNK
jgi:hypothetical protein